MFGFDKPEDGSEERFHERIRVFEEANKPKAKHHFWWLVHNAIAHPLIALMPIRTFFKFHDWTSHKINGE